MEVEEEVENEEESAAGAAAAAVRTRVHPKDGSVGDVHAIVCGP